MAGSRTHLGFTEHLGLVGWRRLEPVLLAALAGESPLLLVGPHGTGKSLLVERVAGALGLPFRHCNASLLNYDDLVGIPLPDEAGRVLRRRPVAPARAGSPAPAHSGRAPHPERSTP